jgi:hypothetical protein
MLVGEGVDQRPDDLAARLPERAGDFVDRFEGGGSEAHAHNDQPIGLVLEQLSVRHR